MMAISLQIGLCCTSGEFSRWLVDVDDKHVADQ